MNSVSLVSTLIFVITSTPALADDAIVDKNLGLSKTSVYDSPSHTPYHYAEQFPGGSERLPRAYLNAPPQIPHNIEPFIPIKANNNMCLGCHNQPDNMGKIVKGQPTAMPKSHYTDLRNAPNEMQKQPIGARFVCTQCHVPQANVKPLVENTFNKKP